MIHILSDFAFSNCIATQKFKNQFCMNRNYNSNATSPPVTFAHRRMTFEGSRRIQSQHVPVEVRFDSPTTTDHGYIAGSQHTNNAMNDIRYDLSYMLRYIRSVLD